MIPDSRAPIRLVVFSSLYPNALRPRHGIFVEQRLRRLAATGRVEVCVVAPVPWFFSTHPRFGRYAQWAAVPLREYRHGFDVLHPRYPVIPRIGMTLAPACMAAAVAPTIKRLRADGFDFDLIDAHYFYPDGVAAAKLAHHFERPLVITARGTDINTIANLIRPRQQIRRAAARADALIAVSNALADKLVKLGVEPGKITTLANGIDLERFSPEDPKTARARLGLSGSVWLFVGNLVSLKGVDIALRALSSVPDATLLIVGEGAEEQNLRVLTSRLSIADRVRFIGHVEQASLSEYYSAADALVLPSESEGMPNVALEAMACGTAVIAAAVGGIPEIVSGLPAGVLMRQRTPAAIVECWAALKAYGTSDIQRAARRRYAEQFDWAATTTGQLELFDRVLGRDRHAEDAHASGPCRPSSVSAQSRGA